MAELRNHDELFIGGAWVPSTGTGSIDVVDPSTEEVCGSVPDGTPADVDAAVAAAREAFDSGWGHTTIEERRKAILALVDALEARQSELAEVLSTEMGMPITYAGMVQAGMPINNLKLHAELIDQVEWETTVGNSLVVREGVGVVGAITPWNYPLHQIICKLAPVLATGSTMVLKPSEVAPLDAFVLAEAVEEAGIPAGVFNLVTGTGPVVGEAIASHPDIDMVSFTGSTRAGTRVAELASPTVKRVALELGGKSANVFLDDADFEKAVGPNVTFACFLNSGQTCTALTRMIVPRDRHDEVAELARKAAEEVVMGPATDPAAFLGPLVSAAQRDRVRGYIQKGIEEGATLVTGGVEPPEGLETGYFVRPTVFADVTPEMTIAREEIFGPVLAIMPYDSEEQALEIANDSDYGLSGGVQSADQDRAVAFARRMRTGQVDVNGGAFNLLSPFGGYKRSGTGREKGRWGIEEFTEVKSLQLPG